MIRDLLRSLEDRSCKSLIEDRTEPGGQRLQWMASAPLPPIPTVKARCERSWREARLAGLL
jgi:hypothetical protein